MMDEHHQYLEAFESCRLAPGEFSHRDHVRVGWLMLNEGSLEETLARFSASLRRFAAHVGADGLYHQTITWHYLFVINERMAGMTPGHAWEAFAEANPDLFESHKAFMGRYYSSDVLESELARRDYVLPNRVSVNEAVAGSC